MYSAGILEGLELGDYSREDTKVRMQGVTNVTRLLRLAAKDGTLPVPKTIPGIEFDPES